MVKKHKELHVDVSSTALPKVLQRLRLSYGAQWVKVWVVADVPVERWSEGDLPDEYEYQILKDISLIDLDEAGIVISLDPDQIHQMPLESELEPDVHAYRPLFVPWAHVLGIAAYRNT